MKPETQRIAIAEACGWTKCRTEQGYLAWGNDPDTGYQQKLPNYLDDLNAMHEAEKTCLPEYEQLNRYSEELIGIVVRDNLENRPVTKVWFNATAAQRAEAFLRTIGKWTES